MEGPLPSLNVSSGVSNGPQEPQPDGRQQARKSTVPRGVRFNASNESLGDGQMLYGGGNGGGQAPGTGTMSRVLSLRTAKSAGSLFNFNPEDPAELLATAADLPSMRGMSDKLASPRSTARRTGGMSKIPHRPAYVRAATLRPRRLHRPANACAALRQMTLDNEDGTTPNYGGERHPDLRTGIDAADFFARNRGAASIKFVHLNFERTGDDYRPYDLVVVRPEDVRAPSALAAVREESCWRESLGYFAHECHFADGSRRGGPHGVLGHGHGPAVRQGDGPAEQVHAAR